MLAEAWCLWYNSFYMKKLLITIALLVVVPLSVGAASPTLESLLAQISQLQKILVELIAQQNSSRPVCHTFTTDLTVGVGGLGGGSRPENDSDRDVRSLRDILIYEKVADFVNEQGTAGSSIKNTTFNEVVAAAVVKFQAKYGIKQTGYVGPLTRTKLNSLYGCTTPRACTADAMQCPDGSYVGRSGSSCQFVCPTGGSNKPPVISGISGPTTLLVGEVGTWTIKATDPENGSLSYDINWGDTNQSDILVPNTTTSKPYLQTSTFTHSYSSPGNYTVTAWVRDDKGVTARSTISLSVNNKIAVLSPNGGEIWEARSVQQIKWKTADSINKINIYLQEDPNRCFPNRTCTTIAGGHRYTLDKNISTDRIYNWIVGTDVDDEEIPAGYYQVLICDEAGKQCSFSKNSFIIEE